MNWLSAITAVSKVFGALTGLYRDWRLRRAGARAVFVSKTPTPRLIIIAFPYETSDHSPT